MQNSSWDVGLVKRVSRDALGTKDSTFKGDEHDRNVLWTSLVTSLQTAFEQKDSANDDLFDLADATKEYAGLRADSAAPRSALAVRVQEAWDSLRQLKQAAGGAEDVHHFPMLHFDSATTVEDATVKHDTVDIAASDTGDNVVPFRKQFIYSEPPFEQSFMDKMSVSLGFNEPE
ncbi:hypothetical protein CYMTET_23627 [Cymbomonas tetramitiformis]|uniref:Uncharacterized protein n=1 Tax=Cymbomonas tetramitiformis TaxID=36881 RepID=A0AAE0L0X6_9CHLO|nr:hypothetical protein CYMTET_23627 [Cymbomonas tetramitiformis]